MRFRITYSGGLKSSNKPRREEKIAVRAHIHPQLVELRRTHPALRGVGLVHRSSTQVFKRAPGQPVTVEQPVFVKEGQKAPTLATVEPMFVDRRPYIPLVRNSLHLTCSIDILFLRKDSPGLLVRDGNTADLDNRLKTLFDDLRMPVSGEVTMPVDPLADFAPVQCLLENDNLIIDFNVKTDRLLTNPGSAESEVLLVMEIIVKPSRLNSHNIGFLGE